MANMIDNFRRWVGNHLNHLSKVTPCSLSLQKLGDMKRVLIISETNTPEQDAALDKLRHETSSLIPNARISAVCLYRKDKKTPARISAGNMLYLSQDNFSFFYKFNSEEFQGVLSEQYDVILVSALSDNRYISYILPYLRAVIKVGLKNAYQDLVNIMIDSNTKSLETYNKEALANIKMIFGQK